MPPAPPDPQPRPPILARVLIALFVLLAIATAAFGARGDHDGPRRAAAERR
jgi:hypothetical protein